MKVLQVIILLAISAIGIIYGLGQMLNKKYQVDELYWQAEGKTISETQKQERIRQLDERGKIYSIKYVTSFTLSAISFIIAIFCILKIFKQKK